MTTIRQRTRTTDPIAQHLRMRVDVWLLLAVAALIIIGLQAVYTASYDVAALSPLSNNDAHFYVRKQATFLLGGLAAMWIVLRPDYHFYQRFSTIGLFGTLALVVITGTVGQTRFGAQRALLNGSVQPSELAKLVIILFSAHWISTKMDRLGSFKLGLLPYGVIVGVMAGSVLLLPKLSAAILIAAICFSMFFVAGANLLHFVVAFAVGIVGFLGAVEGVGYAQQRIDDWTVSVRDPISSPQEQVRYAALSIGAGGLFGKGLGGGEIKYRLPVAHSDSVFAVWGEETGFVGSVLVIGAYALFAWRGILAARRARDMYGFLLAIGVTCWICFQALLNMGVVTSLFPTTGVTMPFISYGGTSLFVSLVGIGVLLNVSRDASIGATLRSTRSGRTNR